MKKLLLSIFLVVALLMSSLPSFVNASPVATKVSVTYDVTTDKILISGYANGLTSIRVLKDGTDTSTLSDTNLPVYVDTLTFYGNFSSYEFGLAEESDYGKYIVCISDNNGYDEDSFICYNKYEADAVVSAIGSQKLSTYMNEGTNANKVGIDIQKATHSNAVFDLMENVYTSYTDSSDFNKKYNLCLVINQLKGKTQGEVEAILSENESVLGISYQNDYVLNSLMSANDKTALCASLSSMKYDEVLTGAQNITKQSGFKAVYNGFVAVSLVNNASNYKGIQKIYTQDISFLKTNVVNANAKYKNVSPSDVFGILENKTFTTPYSLKTHFDSAVNSLKSPQGGGSSGDSDFGSSSSVGVDSTIPDDDSYDVIPGEENDGPGASASASASAGTIGTNLKEFYDVLPGAWYEVCVESLAGEGIISGDNLGAFRPNDFITRAEFTKLITEAFSLSGGEASEFADVEDSMWYASYIKRASGAGVITGYNGLFRPNDYISRQDATVILYRIASLLGAKYEGFKKPNDVNEISLYATSAVGVFYANGVVNGGSPGYFKPHNSITRAESAQLIYNLINDLPQRLVKEE